jgi:hypothetical protein
VSESREGEGEKSDMTFKTDRSRILTYQRCPRSRYFEYEFGGHGVRRKAQAIPLVTGKHVHAGLAALLMEAVKGPVPGEMYEFEIEAAVKVAHKEYDKELTERGLQLSETEQLTFVAAEQRALIEALVRAWAIIGLPRLLQQFTIAIVPAVSPEQDTPAVETEIVFPFGPSGQFMSRPDAILQERESGDLYALSFKTAASLDKRREREALHDDQGISEMLAVESLMGRKCSGVLYNFLIKGPRKEYPDDSGQYVQWSPLIRYYKKDGLRPLETEYAAQYQWKDEFGNTRRLGKGWVRENAWDHDGGVKWWVGWLAQNQPALLEEQIITPPVIYRNTHELQGWLRQRIYQERAVAASAHVVEALRVVGREQFLPVLDEQFPQNRRSCDWPGQCQFTEICHGPIDPMDPLSDSGFEVRVPNHPAEAEVPDGETAKA